MAEPILFAELELRIALLPPISRGAHLGGSAIHAERLVELWKVEAGDDVPLEQAFRLLDAETVAGAILRATLAKDAGVEAWTVEHLAKFWDAADHNDDGEASAKDYPSDPRYWTPPTLSGLLLELRALCWKALLLDETLLVEAVKGLRGTRRRAVLPGELARLRPDWSLSRLCLGERDEFIAARVRRAPSKPVKKRWRSRPSGEAVGNAMREIAKGYRSDARPTFEQLSEAVNNRLAHLGLEEATREQVRNALKEEAPQLRRERGRPKSPT